MKTHKDIEISLKIAGIDSAIAQIKETQISLIKPFWEINSQTPNGLYQVSSNTAEQTKRRHEKS